MISKKKAPHVSDTELSRVVNQIYDDINELISAVNQEVNLNKNNAGKAGNIQLRFDKANNKYYIEGKFETGWAGVEASLNKR
jgi:hypothetical protein